MDENKNEELNEDIKEDDIKEVVESEVNTDEVALEKVKENKLLPIISTVLVGIVLIASMVLLVFSIFSPKNAFFRLVNNSLSGISKNVSGFSDSTFGKLLAIDINSKLNIDAKIKGNVETDDLEIKEWFNGLESFELNVIENVDFSNDYTDTNAKFILNGEDFLDGVLVKNKDIISLKLADITDGYITVDNNNLESLWEKLNYNGPTSLDTSTDLLKELNFSKKDINNLKTALEKFGAGFLTAFDDEDFSYGEGVVTYDEGTIECKSMDFIVNAIDLNNGIISGLEEVISKEKYVDSIYKVISTIDKVSGYEPFTREEFGKNLNDMLEQIRSLEFTEDDAGFIIRIYYKGNDILKVELRSEDYNMVIFEFTCVSNKDSGYYKFFDGTIIYEDKVTTIDNVTNHLLTVDYIDYETGEVLEGYGSEISINIDSTNKNSQIISLKEKVRLLSYDTDLSTLDIMSIEPTVVRDYTLKGSIDKDDNLVELTMIDGDGTYTSTFTVDATIKENAEFEYLNISEDENFDVSKKTDDEINSKKDKVISNWNSKFGTDNSKLNQFEMAISMYLSMFIPMDYYSGDDATLEELDLDEFQIVG